MKAYKCPKCGYLDLIIHSQQSFLCLEENCDWVFEEHDDSEIIEVVEIIDWEKELTKTEENGKD